jgi:hypothetical protein
MLARSSARRDLRRTSIQRVFILDRSGEEEVRRSVHMHINYGLFANILSELASSVERIRKDDIVHRDQLARAVAESHRALSK